MRDEAERRLREALYALNRAIPPSDDLDPPDVVELRRIRGEVWSMGVALYGWTD